jgi:hypothetical protein
VAPDVPLFADFEGLIWLVGARDPSLVGNPGFNESSDEGFVAFYFLAAPADKESTAA